MTDVEKWLKYNKITKCPTQPPMPGTTFGINVSKHDTKNGKQRSQKNCWNPGRS
tara:strand:- start:627 stop:788 length:162 start_codon:yes stop_codon:yes gene_type:complete